MNCFPPDPEKKVVFWARKVLGDEREVRAFLERAGGSESRDAIYETSGRPLSTLTVQHASTLEGKKRTAVETRPKNKKQKIWPSDRSLNAIIDFFVCQSDSVQGALFNSEPSKKKDTVSSNIPRPNLIPSNFSPPQRIHDLNTHHHPFFRPNICDFILKMVQQYTVFRRDWASFLG